MSLLRKFVLRRNLLHRLSRAERKIHFSVPISTASDLKLICSERRSLRIAGDKFSVLLRGSQVNMEIDLTSWCTLMKNGKEVLIGFRNKEEMVVCDETTGTRISLTRNGGSEDLVLCFEDQLEGKVCVGRFGFEQMLFYGFTMEKIFEMFQDHVVRKEKFYEQKKQVVKVFGRQAFRRQAC